MLIVIIVVVSIMLLILRRNLLRMLLGWDGLVLFSYLLPKSQSLQRRDVDGPDQPSGGRYIVNGESKKERRKNL